MVYLKYILINMEILLLKFSFICPSTISSGDKLMMFKLPFLTKVYNPDIDKSFNSTSLFTLNLIKL